MEIVKSELIRPFDVDGCLVISPSDTDPDNSLYVDVFDAVTDAFIRMRVHQPMVRLLREEHHRGAHIVVWSRSGYEWAANVVRALDLVFHKRMTVMSKPLVYFDDQDVSTWMRDKVFLNPNEPYKQTKG